jgi:chromosomal replication initiator protein
VSGGHGGPGPAVWGRVCAALRPRIGEQNFASWIAPLRSTWYDGGLALDAPDRTIREGVARHFLGAIEDALAEAAGRAYPVRLGIAAVRRPLPIPLRPPNDRHTFETFVPGESNARALTAAHALVAGESRAPLLVHGPSGVGKTHLLHAICQALDLVGVLVACLPAAQLIAALVAAYASGADERFWDDLSPVGALLLDDIHSVKGLEETQERLVEGLTAWAAAGHLLVLTIDRAAGESCGLVARLGDRLSGTVTASIESPDPALRRAILERKALARGVVLDPRLATRLAAAVGGSARRLEGVLTRLLAHARLSGRPVDERLALEVLPELQRRPAEPPTLERILDVTAAAFAIPARRLRGRAARPELLVPRRVAMYLARKLLGRSFTELAAAFTRDHTTVAEACRTIRARIERDAAFAATVARIERSLRGVEGP